MPFKDITISCLCDVDEGKDLANIAINNADQLSLEAIQEYIKKRALSIKAKNGNYYFSNKENTFIDLLTNR